jgi:hypothetical protein
LCVLSDVCASGLSGASSMVSREVLYLSSLLVHKLASVCEVSIDNLLVLDVDEGAEVDAGSEDQSKTPKWEPLDEVVGHEGSEECL